ncbi:MAG TPA: hypothetical protein VGE76_12095 [Opitutaceae bacterium]
MTASHRRLNRAIERIPPWRRWLICRVFRRAEHRLALAYNIIAVHAHNSLGDFDHYYDMLRRGDRAWLAVYRRTRP